MKKINDILDDDNPKKMKELVEILKLFSHDETQNLAIKLISNYSSKYNCITTHSRYKLFETTFNLQENKRVFTLLIALSDENSYYFIGFDNTPVYSIEVLMIMKSDFKWYALFNNLLNTSFLSKFNAVYCTDGERILDSFSFEFLLQKIKEITLKVTNVN